MNKISNKWLKIILWVGSYINILLFALVGGYIWIKTDNEDVKNEIKNNHIPVELIGFYKKIINPTSAFKEDDYIIPSQKDGFLPLSNASGKIKTLINRFYQGIYNSRSFKNIQENYCKQAIKKEDIIWLNEK